MTGIWAQSLMASSCNRKFIYQVPCLMKKWMLSLCGRNVGPAERLLPESGSERHTAGCRNPSNGPPKLLEQGSLLQAEPLTDYLRRTSANSLAPKTLPCSLHLIKLLMLLLLLLCLINIEFEKSSSSSYPRSNSSQHQT